MDSVSTKSQRLAKLERKAKKSGPPGIERKSKCKMEAGGDEAGGDDARRDGERTATASRSRSGGAAGPSGRADAFIPRPSRSSPGSAGKGAALGALGPPRQLSVLETDYAPLEELGVPVHVTGALGVATGRSAWHERRGAAAATAAAEGRQLRPDASNPLSDIVAELVATKGRGTARILGELEGAWSKAFNLTNPAWGKEKVSGDGGGRSPRLLSNTKLKKRLRERADARQAAAEATTVGEAGASGRPPAAVADGASARTAPRGLIPHPLPLSLPLETALALHRAWLPHYWSVLRASGAEAGRVEERLLTSLELVGAAVRVVECPAAFGLVGLEGIVARRGSGALWLAPLGGGGASRRSSRGDEGAAGRRGGGDAAPVPGPVSLAARAPAACSAPAVHAPAVGPAPAALAAAAPGAAVPAPPRASSKLALVPLGGTVLELAAGKGSLTLLGDGLVREAIPTKRKKMLW